MADTQNQPEDDTDDTADKAAEIGKALGVEDDKPSEDVPDYEVSEEDDAPIAKERQPRADKKERQQLSNREKRMLRKKRTAEKFGEKDNLIRQQAEELQALKQWRSEVDGRLSGINRAEVDAALNKNIMEFSAAEKTHMDAFKEGDGEKATQSMRAMYNAQKNIDQLQTLKAQLEKTASAPAAQNNNQVHPAVVNKATEWARRNNWFKNDGRDVDSEIAKAVSGVLANEGFDPKTDEYWDELDDRLAERLPDKYAQDDDEDEEDDAPPPAKRRSAPPVSGGSKRGDIKGKVAIKLPTSYINMLKENGIWDDVPRRNKIIAERAKMLKEAGQ